MTAAPPRQPKLLSGARPPGALPDRMVRVIAFGAGGLVLIILGLIAFSTTKEAWPAFTHEGLGFVTSDDWNPAAGHFGALAFVYGTMVVSAIAIVIAVPVSIGVALFITELLPRRARTPVIYVVDLLAAIPSVVYGLWGLAVLAPPMRDLYENVASAVSGIPVLDTVFSGDPVSGVSFMTAGIILAIMITPIITAIMREVFATVPRAQKEGALALGATRWEMIRGAVFPHSRSGMVSAAMIGLGRAMGETIAVALVIGSSAKISAQLFGTGDAMPSVIANSFGEATGTWRAALVAMGVVLFGLTIVIGVAARGIAGRAERRMGGAA
ncbi:MAG: phosphate ABC transporter permease subunit PstC [Acidimicrobiia bacterium]